jgi:hypothetical protein
MIALFARGTTLRPCLPVAAVAGHAPADQHAAGRVDLEVVPADRDAVDVDLEGAAGHRPQGGVLAHPADHGGRVGQVPVDLLGRGGQVDLGGE